MVPSFGSRPGSPQQRRPWLTPEECELMDVQKQMEEEMVETYKEVGDVERSS